MRGADLVAGTLASAGVKIIFTLSGNQIMPIFDACIDAGIRLIHTRHEAAAVFMADAYAQMTGRAGVAMVTAAPGFANSVGALYSARQAESPVVLLSGDSPLAQDGRGAFQELDQVSVSAPMTKLSFRSRRAGELGHDIARALRMARGGRPGPVHCALPFDLLNAEAGDIPLPAANACEPEAVLPEPAAVASIAEQLAKAKRPVILAGPVLNPSRAGELLERLADAADAPVVAMESPRGLNDPCLGAFASVLARADTVLSIGKQLDFTTGFVRPPAIAEDCKLLAVDPEAEALDRARRAAGKRLVLAARADAAATVRALIDAGTSGKGKRRKAYREEVAAANATRPEAAADEAAAMHPAVLCAAVQKQLDAANDPVLIVDGGEFGQWAQACLSAKTRIINGPAGAIGGALCYALGAKAARPEATVFVLMGDGTIGFHLAEFETAHRCGLDFVAVIGNDARWNAEYQIQLRDYGEDRTYACELDPTRYDLAVAGLGGHGEHVTDPGELEAALKRAGSSGRPACLNVMIEGVPAPSAPAH